MTHSLYTPYSAIYLHMGVSVVHQRTIFYFIFLFPLQLAVLVVTVAAVSAGLYPVKTGSGKGTSSHSKGGNHKNAEDDRFHMQSADGQYVFGHTSGTQVRKKICKRFANLLLVNFKR